MKKINFLAAIAVILIIGLGACSKSDDPAPAGPTMKNIEMTGNDSEFVAQIKFSEGVYSLNNKTGNLNNESLSISVVGGQSSIENISVSHTAGQETASITIKLSNIPSGSESVVVKPVSNGIYNSEGVAMSVDQSLEAVFVGNTVVIEDNGDGTGTTTWTSNNVYILDGLVFVNEGQTLTIEAGTIIKGRSGQGENASALIVARGGKIIAEGTAQSPIIFTAEADDLAGSVADLDDGLWGGLIILGKAMLNTVPNEQQIEGIPQTEPRGIYGGENDDDNSGVLKYVSIRHGGTDIGEGNEINGLTLGGVGSATTIQYIEVIANKDDGIEFFGGKPNLSNILVAFCGDDSFDYDQGYRGKGQFWAAIQGFERGDRLGEHDGGTDPETGQPYATPTIYNATYLGRGDGAGKRIITFRDNAGGHYANSIFYGQEKGIDIELLADECSYTRFQDEQLTLNNNIFFGISANPILTISAADGVEQSVIDEAETAAADYFTTAQNQIYDPGFSITTDIFNVIPSNDVSGNMSNTPGDGFFKDVNYKGAFEPGTNWAEGWTLTFKYMSK